jgi:hypothetical protein
MSGTVAPAAKSAFESSKKVASFLKIAAFSGFILELSQSLSLS